MIVAPFKVMMFRDFIGFSIVDIDTDPESEFTRALFGISYDRVDKKVYVDLFWKIFQF